MNPLGTGMFTVDFSSTDEFLLLAGNTTNDTVDEFNGQTGAFLSTFASGISGLSDLGLVIGPDGNIYVCTQEGSNSTILRYDDAGNPLPSAGNNGAIFVAAGSGGLNNPESETFGPDGNLYVADIGTESVLEFDGTTGAFIRTFVTSGSGGLTAPDEIRFGPDGDLYVSAFAGFSQASNGVLRYDGHTGTPLPSAGNSGAMFVAEGSGGLSGPNGFCFGPDGELYIADALSNTVRRYDGETGAPAPAPGQSGAIYVTASSGGLGFGDGITFGPDGNLYVANLDYGTVGILRYQGPTGPDPGGFLGVFIPQGSGGSGVLSDPVFLPEQGTGAPASRGPSPLFVGEPKGPASVAARSTQAQLQPVVTQAIAYLAAAGHNISVLSHGQLHVVGFASIDPGIPGHDRMTSTLGAGLRRYPGAVDHLLQKGDLSLGVRIMALGTREAGSTRATTASLRPSAQDAWAPVRVFARRSPRFAVTGARKGPHNPDLIDLTRVCPLRCRSHR